MLLWDWGPDGSECSTEFLKTVQPACFTVRALLQTVQYAIFDLATSSITSSNDSLDVLNKTALQSLLISLVWDRNVWFGPKYSILNLIWKIPKFVSFGANLTNFGLKSDIHGTIYYLPYILRKNPRHSEILTTRHCRPCTEATCPHPAWRPWRHHVTDNGWTTFRLDRHAETQL